MFTFSISKELVITNQRLKTYVVRRSGSEGWQGNHNKISEGRKNYECSVRKFEKLILCFQIKVFLIVFSQCFFCVHYFSFALFTIIRTTKRQRIHISKASNSNKIINYNCEIMAKSRYDRPVAEGGRCDILTGSISRGFSWPKLNVHFKNHG